jgi:hypothetical protein
LFDVVCVMSATIYHIVDATGGTNDDVDTLLEFRHVLADNSATDTRVAFDVHARQASLGTSTGYVSFNPRV